MKRPLSHIIVPVACLLMLPFCFDPGSALGDHKMHGKAAGQFQLQLDGNDAGWIQSVEGGGAQSDVVQEKLGPVPRQSGAAAAPQTNLRTAPQLAPVKPACANPPCGLGQRQTPAVSAGGLKPKQDDLQDNKDSISEMGEMEKLRLQQQQDSRAKADSAASNLLKKQSETSNDIIGNIK